MNITFMIIISSICALSKQPIDANDSGSVTMSAIRPFFILRFVRPRIFESKFRDHCAKKLDGALRKSTSFVEEFA